MAQGGSDGYTSGLGSMDEGSTSVKLVSFGSDPSLETDNICQPVDRSRGMQYPTSRDSRDLYPNQIPPSFGLGLAEGQEEFRTIGTECPNYQSLPPPQDRLITSVTGSQNAHLNIVTSIENNEVVNIPVRTGGAVTIDALDNVNRNSVSSSGGNASSAGRSQSSCDSRAARSVINLILINDETPVRDLPLKLMEFLCLTFDRSDCKNWKDLVNLYNWNYRKISDFKSKHHPDGIFCSLLNENEFQEYTIGNLKDDLDAIPKRDALSDLIRMIDEHNASL